MIALKFFLLLIFSVTICCSESESKKTADDIQQDYSLYQKNYIKSPDPKDIACKNDLEKAKYDLRKFKKIYVSNSDDIMFDDRKPFNEKEILEFASSKGVKVINHTESCISFEGQNDFCYEVYINEQMIKLYGKNFRKEIELGAENLVMQNLKNGSKVLTAGELDENKLPKLLNQKNNFDGVISLKANLPLTVEKGRNPIMDFSFIIEKDGKISNLKNNHWVSYHDDNSKYRFQLEKLAMSTILKKYNKWKPAEYKGVVSRFEGIIRIIFM